MNREITIEIEKLIGMFIIARGTPIGVGFTYHPKLPKPLTENLNFAYGRNANFVCLRVNSNFEVECWFKDGDDNTFSYNLKEVKKRHPFLYVAIFTHVFDMIENIDM